MKLRARAGIVAALSPAMRWSERARAGDDIVDGIKIGSF
jgi:hypothetical protein